MWNLVAHITERTEAEALREYADEEGSINLAQDMDKRRDFANTVMNVQFP